MKMISCDKLTGKINIFRTEQKIYKQFVFLKTLSFYRKEITDQNRHDHLYIDVD